MSTATATKTLVLTDKQKAQIKRKNIEIMNCISEYFGEIGRLPETIETLGLLLESFIRDEGRNWNKEWVLETTTRVTELSAFITEIGDLHRRRNEDIIRPQEDFEWPNEWD